MVKVYGSLGSSPEKRLCVVPMTPGRLKLLVAEIQTKVRDSLTVCVCPPWEGIKRQEGLEVSSKHYLLLGGLFCSTDSRLPELPT